METKEIITPIQKHKVVLKSFITGRDVKAINSALFDGTDISNIGSSIGGEQLTRMNDKSLLVVVTEVDGKSDDILNLIEDMHSVDYNFVLEEVQKVTNYEDVKKNK